jgi:TM2 domain-containing membrane protein YozV
MSTERAGTSPTDLEAALALAEHHPQLAATVLATGAALVFASAMTVVSLLHLPALVLTAPWALALSLAASSLMVARQARKRLGTGGLDPDTERRIVGAAVEQGGRITTTSVAHALSIPLHRAERALTTLARAGYVAIETDQASGAVVYVLPEVDAGLVRTVISVTPGPASPAPLVLRDRVPAGELTTLVRVSHKCRKTAALLAIFGGVIGAHKFYLGRPVAGLLYVVTFPTLLPAIAGLVEGFGYLVMSEHAFDLQYNVRLA